jgi:hypothetical protein
MQISKPCFWGFLPLFGNSKPESAKNDSKKETFYFQKGIVLLSL